MSSYNGFQIKPWHPLAHEEGPTIPHDRWKNFQERMIAINGKRHLSDSSLVFGLSLKTTMADVENDVDFKKLWEESK